MFIGIILVTVRITSDRHVPALLVVLLQRHLDEDDIAQVDGRLADQYRAALDRAIGLVRSDISEAIAPMMVKN